MVSGIGNLSINYVIPGKEIQGASKTQQSSNESIFSGTVVNKQGNNDTQVNKSDDNNQEKSDQQQLNEDAVWLAQLYQGLQDGEPWAIEEAEKLEIADDPDS